MLHPMMNMIHHFVHCNASKIKFIVSLLIAFKASTIYLDFVFCLSIEFRKVSSIAFKVSVKYFFQ